jgi:hypothetical protein
MPVRADAGEYMAYSALGVPAGGPYYSKGSVGWEDIVCIDWPGVLLLWRRDRVGRSDV